jgi:uncharacterized membrane protein (UPF0127 family)
MQAPPARRPNRAAPVLAGLAVVVVLAVVAAGVVLLFSTRTDRATKPKAGAPATTHLEAGAAATVPFELRPAGRDPVRVRLEVAATEAQRELGLMNRTSLPDGTGMVFLFPADSDVGFWMKNTLIPLSIAFVAADGRVVSVHEMVPCRADPCQVYPPGGPYRYAIELAAGAFPAAGIGPGDSVVPLDPVALPAAS